MYIKLLILGEVECASNKRNNPTKTKYLLTYEWLRNGCIEREIFVKDKRCFYSISLWSSTIKLIHRNTFYNP